MALPADVVKRGGVRDDLYIVDGLYLRIRAVPALLSSVVFAGVRADRVRFGIRKCDLWAGDATRSAGELSVVGCRSGCGESCCRSYPDGTALWRDDEAGDAGQREGTIWLDMFIGIFFLLMLLSYRYLNRNTVGRLPGMRQIKRVMKRDVCISWL